MLSRRTLNKLFVAAGCATFMVGAAHAQDTEVKFALDWRFEGPAAGFLLAEDNGYFADYGIGVTIDPGSGSVDTISRVASGTYDMGFGDINSLARFLDEDPSQPVVAIMMIYDTPTFAVVGRKSLGVTEDPHSLEGKKLGAPPPDGAFAQWPAFVEASGIDTSGITIESIGFPVREPMLAQGDVDAVFGFAFSVILNLKAQGVADDDISPIMMAENGLDLYGNAILVNTNFAAENPEAVKGVVAAISKGFIAAIKDPQAGVDAVMARNEILDPAIELERLNMAIDMNIVTDYTKANGLGGVDMGRLSSSLEQLKTSMGLQGKVTAEDVFDASYLPPAGERMIP